MKRMKTRFICHLLIVCMILGLATGVHAADQDFQVEKNGVVSGSYATLAEAITACKSATASTNAVIVMNADADLGSTNLQITGGVFTIDLNGHSITANCTGTGAQGSAIYVSGSTVQLTIADSSEDQTGAIVNTGTFGINANLVHTLTINGGKISGSGYALYVGADKTKTNQKLIINGGTMITSTDSQEAVYVFSNVKTINVTGGTIGDIQKNKYGLYCERGATISGGNIYGKDTAFATSATSIGAVTVSGGTFTGGGQGIYVFHNGMLTVSGGTISGGRYDIAHRYRAKIDVSGGAFPDGISIDGYYGDTLNSILVSGYAYWAGETMLTVPDTATEIMDKGTITVKPICAHDPASVDETGRCACGMQYVASATIGGETRYYQDLPAAFEAVKDCTADDEALVKLFANVELGDTCLEVASGEFTLDLNNCVISNTYSQLGPIAINSAGKLTVTDGSEGKNGGIRSENNVALVVGINCELTVEAGNIYGPRAGICAYGTLNMSGGRVEGGEYGIYAEGADVTVTGGEILSDLTAVYATFESDVTITGGSITGQDVDIRYYEDSSVVLTLAESATEGATFPSGIELYDNTLNALLGEGMAYWQNGKPLTLADDATEITGGDVTVKAQCNHTGGEATCETGKICGVCGEEYTEALGHNYGEPVIVWNEDNTATATVTCANDETHVVELEVEVTSETTEGDCETAPVTTYTATVLYKEKTYTSTKKVEGELGQCVDEDKDHACDVCGENVGKHEDTNKDHKCDYGCSETIGVCEDKDNDGKCDYGCDKEFEVKPTEPDPTEPKPTDPESTEPKPTEPDATEPEVKVEGVTRLAGENRLVTSELIANQLKEKMGVEKFQNIIVASGGTFADALPGSYLAAVKNAPIVLTLAKQKYIDQTANYIKANLAEGGTVYILGGESAVPKLMEEALAGINVKRVAGADRFGTNLAILKEAGVKAGDEILVCTAKEFADSLSAAATGKPILLVYKKITDEQKTYLGTLSGCKFTVVGGTTAVPENLEEAMKAYGEVSRLAGKDRLDTSILVAKKYFPDATSSVVAYGWDFPDGLCGGSLAYATKSPLILAHSKEKLVAFTAEYTEKSGLNSGYVLGGEGLISNDAAQKLFCVGPDEITVLK